MPDNLHLTLERKLASDQGTFGRLSGPGLSLYSAELPWRDNAQNLSRIPAGSYECVPHSSMRYPEAFLVQGVPGRSAILIHSGNWAGDVKKGLRSDSSGCILVGTSADKLSGQQAVLDSKTAITMLQAWAGGQAFTLTILDAIWGKA